MTWMFNVIEVNGKPRLHVSVNLVFWSMAAILCDSVAAPAVVVVPMRPRAMPLAMVTMRKPTHGFPFLSYMSVGLPLAA